MTKKLQVQNDQEVVLLPTFLRLVLWKIKIIKFCQEQRLLPCLRPSSRGFDFKTALTSNSSWNHLTQKTIENKFSHLEKRLEQVEAFSSSATTAASSWKPWLRKKCFSWRKFCQSITPTLKSIQGRWLHESTVCIRSRWRGTIKSIWF